MCHELLVSSSAGGLERGGKSLWSELLWNSIHVALTISPQLLLSSRHVNKASWKIQYPQAKLYAPPYTLSNSNAIQIPARKVTVIVQIWLSVQAEPVIEKGLTVSIYTRSMAGSPSRLRLSFGTFAFQEIKHQKFLSMVGGCWPGACRELALFKHAGPWDETRALSVRHSWEVKLATEEVKALFILRQWSVGLLSGAPRLLCLSEIL